MTRLHILMFFVLALLVTACANVGSPTGGPQDKQAPKVKSSFPKDQSLNVKAQNIVLEFDEYIEVKNIKSKLTVVPNTGNEFDYEVKKNILTIKFEKPLEENTTYVVDFGESIEDITEHNKAINIRLAFSTGDMIDSLRIAGEVIDLLSNKPVQGAVVGLYRAGDTLDVDKNKPLYYTRSDSTGNYKIGNIKAGSYKIYALKEGKKSDQIYNANDERIGILGGPVEISGGSVPDITLHVVQYGSKKLAITSARPRRQYFEVKANQPISQYEINFTDSSYRSLIAHNLDGDVVRFYNMTGKPATDSIEANIALIDSAESRIEEKIKIKFDAPKELTGKSGGFNFMSTSPAKITPGEKFELKILFSKPVKTVQTDSIRYRVDKDSIRYKLKPEEWEWNHNRTEARLTHRFKFSEQLNITFAKAAFISVENDSSASRPFAFSVKKPEEYGSISGTVKSAYPSIILQLLNDKGKVEQEIKNPVNFKFVFVEPGNKKLRVLIDNDGDGKWEAGNFQQRIPPEQIFYVPEALSVKPNWDLENVSIEIKKE